MKSEGNFDSVVVVAGFSRSHLLLTIGMLHSADTRVLGVSAFAPRLRFLPKKVVTFFHLDKFTYRRNLMGDAPVKQIKFAELLFQLAVRVPNPSESFSYRMLTKASFELFSRMSYKTSIRMKQNEKTSLLIRSGFGSAFYNDSRKFISDASLPHPNVLKSLIRTGEMKFEPVDKRDVVSQFILADTYRADLILVNSEFVKQSFVFAGVPENKIVVAYLPPTRIFQESLTKPIKTSKSSRTSLKILFAGTLEERKGINEILCVAENALKMSLNFEFTLIGKWGEGTNHMKARISELSNCRVVKWKSQADLYLAMQEADVFLFPSRAEGGARVVTEAMCVGMPIITTSNSGSPIKHLRDGILVNPLDSNSILVWLNKLSSDVALFQSLATQSRLTIKTELTEANYLKVVRQICSF